MLFPTERRLCNHVFAGFFAAAASCFKEICQGSTFQLLNFVDAVADGSPSAWSLFKMLAMFEKLCYVIPKLQSFFPNSLVNQKAIAVKNRLGEANKNLFMKSDNLIFSVPEAKQVTPANGQRHPMTVQVMSYLNSAYRSLQMLEKIVQEYPKVEASSFIMQMEQIMVLLERELIDKSENYKDPALCYLFMMNNRTHIREAINKSRELGTIFDHDWLLKNQAKIQQDLELYQRSSWNKLLDFLKLDNNESVEPNDNITTELLKDKLNLFNIHFEEICTEQSTWSAYDERLREEIIITTANMLLLAYGIFIGRFQDILGNQAYKYIEYGMLEIEDRLNNLFLVNTVDE